MPELEDLQARGYFDRGEVKRIVQRRQDFEYALKRMAAVKEDYLRYVEYECKLEALRELRRRERGIAGRKTLADYCIPRRVHFIFERALRKFKCATLRACVCVCVQELLRGAARVGRRHAGVTPTAARPACRRGDLTLWTRWLRYCQRSGSARQMSRVLARALQLHPAQPALWAYAAAWEFEHNLNAPAARALMQRGLRMCKHAPELWHEYFRMELLYALRLRERRRVLGIPEGVCAARPGARTPRWLLERV